MRDTFTIFFSLLGGGGGSGGGGIVVKAFTSSTWERDGIIRQHNSAILFIPIILFFLAHGRPVYDLLLVRCETTCITLYTIYECTESVRPSHH